MISHKIILCCINHIELYPYSRNQWRIRNTEDTHGTGKFETYTVFTAKICVVSLKLGRILILANSRIQFCKQYFLQKLIDNFSFLPQKEKFCSVHSLLYIRCPSFHCATPYSDIFMSHLFSQNGFHRGKEHASNMTPAFLFLFFF